ncbi:Amidase-like protein 10 [Elsinoe fawcettii]|nr:Amidase-like protein 10 [Elsinoe fawcettii]
MSPEPAYKAISRRKLAERDAKIPSEWRLKQLPPPSQTNLLDIPRTCGILTPEELRLTELLDATALLEELLSGKVKAVDVTRAFCKRAAVAQQLVHLPFATTLPFPPWNVTDAVSQTNCLSEIFFDLALARAAELDAFYARSGPVGPLHGLPISLKDTFRLPGIDSSIGLASLCFKPSTSPSALVSLLLDAGAVLYVKTNVPQTMMALDSHNNVFGRTLNPANTKLTAGGSSGGEGALVAMRGSLLGVGTDVGGSVRIPAMCNGLVGVKPSHGRVPYANQEGGARAGSEALGVRASAGPIAWSVRDCELFFRTVGEMRAWEGDVEVVPLPWKVGRREKLMIGVVRTDGVTTPLPPIAGFVEESVQKLRKVGDVEVVEMDITPLMKRTQTLVNKFFSVDGGNQMFDLIEATGEPLSPWLQSRLKRRPQASLDRVRELFGLRNQLQTEFLEIWKEEGGWWQGHPKGQGKRRLDVLIAPVAPHPLPEIDKWNTAGYTSSFVLLDYAAGTLTVRNMGERDLGGDVQGQETNSAWDKYNRTLWDGDRRRYLGTPLCLQVIGQRLAEEKVVEVMSRLEEVLTTTGTGNGGYGKVDSRARL